MSATRDTITVDNQMQLTSILIETIYEIASREPEGWQDDYAFYESFRNGCVKESDENLNRILVGGLLKSMRGPLAQVELIAMTALCKEWVERQGRKVVTH